MIIFYCTQGVYPSIEWLGIIYYCFAACCFAVSLAMITSVLNMIARDTRKLILACMRLILAAGLFICTAVGTGAVHSFTFFNVFRLVGGFAICQFTI